MSQSTQPTSGEPLTDTPLERAVLRWCRAETQHPSKDTAGQVETRTLPATGELSATTHPFGSIENAYAVFKFSSLNVSKFENLTENSLNKLRFQIIETLKSKTSLNFGKYINFIL